MSPVSNSQKYASLASSNESETLWPALDPKSESESPVDFSDSLELELIILCWRRMSEATVMLAAIEQGDPKAAEDLLVLVYNELRASAKFKMSQEAPGQTLQPTALVHEAWMRLMAGHSHTFKGRRHFFGAASEAMRRILIDRARRRHAQRHGGGHYRVHMEEIDLATPDEDGQFLAVHDALDKLALEYPVQVELVKLRFIVGMTNEQAAEVLGISPSTGKNYWNFAQAWLLNEIKPQ